MISSKLVTILTLTLLTTLTLATDTESSQPPRIDIEDFDIDFVEEEFIDRIPAPTNVHECCECDDECRRGPFGERLCCNGLCKYKWDCIRNPQEDCYTHSDCSSANEDYVCCIGRTCHKFPFWNHPYYWWLRRECEYRPHP